MSEKNESAWQALMLRHIFVFGLFAFGCAHAGDQEASGMRTIEGSIWCREPIVLPPSAQIHVHLEDAARMDSPSEVIASSSIDPRGGPPWSFTLPYDPETLHDRGRYVLRVRIEADGRLLFINTQSTPAFAGAASAPLQIRVSQVASSRPGDGSPVPDASLTDTYWKLVELDGQAAGLGAGQRELHMVLTSDGRRVRPIRSPTRDENLPSLTGPYDEIGAVRLLHRPLGEGWGEGTIRGEALFQHPGWLGSPHDRLAGRYAGADRSRVRASPRP